MTIRARRLGLLVAVVLLVGVAGPALAHVPGFPGDNDSPESATTVPNPSTSYAFYDRVERSGAVYYRAYLLAGETLSLSAFAPGQDSRASIAVLSPAFGDASGVPEAVTVPEGYGARVFEGSRADHLAFEPFTPGAYAYTVDVDVRAPEDGPYLVAVYEPGGRAGPVGLAIGSAERFTPLEYLTVPVDTLAIHDWEGDSALLLLGPAAAVAVPGLAVFRRRLSDRDNRRIRWVLGLAVVGVLATSGLLAAQLLVALATSGPTAAAAVPLALLVLPLGIAAWVSRVATGPALALSGWRRLGLLLAGGGWGLTWAGLLVAPLLAILVALVPRRWVE